LPTCTACSRHFAEPRRHISRLGECPICQSRQADSWRASWGVIDVIEDAVHVVIAILLAVLGVGLITDTVRRIALVLVGTYSMPAVLAVLDPTLLLATVAVLQPPTRLANSGSDHSLKRRRQE
jgi:hypothetical protein